MKLNVETEQSGKIPSINDPISKISVITDGQNFSLDSGTEEEKIPEALKLLRHYAQLIASGKADLHDLVVTKQLSKHPYEYHSDSLQVVAARQLLKEGVEIFPGQTIRYIILDEANKKPDKRVIAAELFEPSTCYDVNKYLGLLLSSAETIFGPINYTFDRLGDLSWLTGDANNPSDEAQTENIKFK